MVAFEAHAASMIDALWSTVSDIYGASKDDLTYFKVHVGGDDPAEAYHVQMTQAMVQESVKMDEWERFVYEFAKSYQANLRWCEAIKALDV